MTAIREQMLTAALCRRGDLSLTARARPQITSEHKTLEVAARFTTSRSLTTRG
jgi:hypothetical protein